jgi:hypothetical protein
VRRSYATLGECQSRQSGNHRGVRPRMGSTSGNGTGILISAVPLWTAFLVLLQQDV